jgi:hypothetical protein
MRWPISPGAARKLRLPGLLSRASGKNTGVGSVNCVPFG